MRNLYAPIMFLMLAAFGGLPGCAMLSGVDKPQIKGVHPRIEGLDLKGVNLAFDVDILNPYPAPIKTPRFKYGLDVAGTQFAQSETASKFDLPARKVGKATLPVRIGYADLWKVSQSLINANEAAYTLNGAFLIPVAGRDFELPLSHTGKIPILQLPKFSITKLQPADISLTHAKLAVDTTILNPNIFEIGLEKLGYALRLGDLEIGGLRASTAGKVGSGQSRPLTLTGEVSAMSAIRQLLGGGNLGAAQLLPAGELQTPYGPVNLTGLGR